VPSGDAPGRHAHGAGRDRLRRAGAAKLQRREYGLEARYQGLSPKLDINAAGLPAADSTSNEMQLFTSWSHRKPEGPFLRWFLYPIAYARVSWDGVPQMMQLGLDSEFLFKRFIFTSPQVFVTFPGGYDDFETLDGAHFERPANIDANWVVNSNRPTRCRARSGCSRARI
jgi:hypothetical protein